MEVSGAAIGVAFGEIIKLTKNFAKVIIDSKSSCKEIKGQILGLKSMIDDISKLRSDLYPQKEPEWRSFQSLLQDGLDLVNKMENLRSFDIFRKYRYGKKILKLEKKINDFMSTRGMGNMMFDNTQRFNRLEEMVQQIMSSMDEGTNAEEANGSGAQVRDLPSFVVGLNNVISDVRRILLQDGVDIVTIKGIGGSGKSTLASALCKDTQVKDSFQSNIIFITISRQPDVKAVLETMWDTWFSEYRGCTSTIADKSQEKAI